MKKLVLLIAVALPLTAGLALAEETVCEGSLGAVTVDNLLVPEGATCLLNRTKIQGTIVVKTGASLHAKRIKVNGNVQAEGAALVQVLAKSTVGGSIQVVQGGSAWVDSSKVTMDILYDSNTGPLAATRNGVGGNIQVFQNTGGVEISDNFVDGNLQCTANEPAPTGGGNVVQGNKENQCAGL